MNIADARTWLINELNSVSPSPGVDADCLLINALGQQRAWLYAHPESELSAAQSRQLGAELGKRKTGYPIAYLIGRQEFWSLELLVSPEVLIPRADTETLVEKALAFIPARENWRILDAGTGSGAIAAAIASERPHCQVVAVDMSKEAVAMATENARRHKLHNMRCLVSDWYTALDGQQFELIVSNPPYIAPDDVELDDAVRQFEPLDALLASNNGLHELERVISGAVNHLTEDGRLLVEHGHTQQVAVAALLGQYGFTGIQCFPDLARRPRVSVGLRADPAVFHQLEK